MLSHWQVQENKLFSVSPQSGTLLPGQKRAVYFSYRSENITLYHMSHIIMSHLKTELPNCFYVNSKLLDCSECMCLQKAALIWIILMMWSKKHLNAVLHRHDFAGTDRFPVVFKLSHGREILVSLIPVLFLMFVVGTFSLPLFACDVFFHAAELTRGDSGERQTVSPLCLWSTRLHLCNYWGLQSSKAGVCVCFQN